MGVLIKGVIHMEKSFIFEYLDENDFRKRERSVRKYNMLAYKKLTFEYYPELRRGHFLGEKVSEDTKAGTMNYELKLPTDELFAKVHGEIRVHYTVYPDKRVILLTNITPEGILNEFYDYNLLKNLLENKTENYRALLAKHDIAKKLVIDGTLNENNKSILNKLFENDLNFLTMGYLNKNQENNIIEILCNLAKMAIEKNIFNNDERTLIDRLINTQSESQTVKEKQNLLKNLAIEKGIITA